MPFNDKDISVLFWGVTAILVLASITGLILKKLKGNTSEIANLNTRIKAWWAIVFIFGSAFWLGHGAVILLFLILSFLGLREFILIIPKNPNDYYLKRFSYGLVIPIQYILISINAFAMYTLFIPIFVFLLLPIFALLSTTTHQYLERTAKLQWGLMITVYCVSCIPALLTLQINGFDGKNLLLIAFLVIVVQLSDVLQYVFGKLFGKHPIAPKLSPSKTIEGFIGGILSSTLIGTSLFWVTPFSVFQAALISLIITLLGFIGGLVMSAIKRDGNIKDWGTLINGHGGLLDRLDSLCFSAPVFFHIVHYWWG